MLTDVVLKAVSVNLHVVVVMLGDIMSVGVLSTICVVLFHSIQSSSIITRDMIRMANSPMLLYNTSIVSPSLDNRLLNPEKLTMGTRIADYQQIFPPMNRQERNGSSTQSRSLESPRISSTIHSNTSLLNSTAKIVSSDKNQDRIENRFVLKQAWSSASREPHVENINKENSSPSTSNISSEELSKRYWDQYKNLSYDFLNTSNYLQTPVIDDVDDKGFQDTNIWDVLQRLYECPWSLGIINCLRESFKGQIGSLFHFQEPQFPRFHQGENPFHNEINVEDSDMDEGRRKLSKKLQMLLPLLMVLKTTMLPALAVMALVSGKAFLISLLSLGVALVAAFVHPAALNASKRHEIAPQAPPPPDHLPSNYYYVM